MIFAVDVFFHGRSQIPQANRPNLCEHSVVSQSRMRAAIEGAVIGVHRNVKSKIFIVALNAFGEIRSGTRECLYPPLTIADLFRRFQDCFETIAIVGMGTFATEHHQLIVENRGAFLR